MAPLAYMEDDEDEGGAHDDSGQNVLVTAPLLEGEKPTVVIITQPQPGKAIMPEKESTEDGLQHQEEERKNRAEMSEILVGSSGKGFVCITQGMERHFWAFLPADLGEVTVVSEDGLAVTSKEEDIPSLILSCPLS